MRKYLVPKPVLVALVASAGLGAVLAAGPHSSRAAAPMTSLPGQRVSRLIHVPRIRLSNGTSTNWSGYAVTGSGFTDVKGSWTVPSITSSPCANAYSAAWVGIDGDNSSTVEQTGTEQDSSGQPYAWYEMYPKGSAYIAPVRAGDTVAAEVKYVGSGNFSLTIKAASWGTAFNTVQRLPQAHRTSAEWIMEAPWSGGVLPLADFNPFGFSGCQAAVGSSSLTGLTNSAEAITMVGNSGPKAVPSSVSNSSGFSVTWMACQ